MSNNDFLDIEDSLPVRQLNAIIAFRRSSGAPVDTMGCSQLGDRGDEKLFRFQTLIALMLSAQTKDEVTAQAVANLRTLPGGLTPSSLSSSRADAIAPLIRRVSFYNTKAKRLISAAQICARDYGGDIPDTVAGLTALPGVGLKMATLAMAVAWRQQVGIGVDVHVHRIANRLQWVKTRQPEQTEAALQKLFPRELWGAVNEAVVGFGQTVCGARRPRCSGCPVADTCAHRRAQQQPPDPPASP